MSVLLQISDTHFGTEQGAVVEALGKQGLKPGLYRFPWANSMAEMKDPAFVEKLARGPVGFVTSPWETGYPIVFYSIILWVVDYFNIGERFEWSKQMNILVYVMVTHEHN